HAITLRTVLPQPAYSSAVRRNSFYQSVISAAAGLPGVSAAGYITGLPMALTFGIWPVAIPGRVLAPAQLPQASLRLITPGYLSAMAISRLSGRDFSAGDTPAAAKVAIVSAGLARLHPGSLRLGRSILIAGEPRRIVGIVSDVRVRGLERRSEPQVYLPAGQAQADVAPWYYPADLVVRVRRGDAMALAGALRAIVHRADPAQPVTGVRPLADLLAAQTLERRTQAALLGGFATLAWVLAMLGIYALLAQRVRTQTRELGVRLALGASRASLLRRVLGAGARVAVVGVIVGAAAAYVASRLLGSLLAGLGPGDLISLAAAAGLCFAMALLGSLVPALAASRLDPLQALRES
ncbi:MAG: ABC transporter permease, partial [Terriglobales bacterium]